MGGATATKDNDDAESKSTIAKDKNRLNEMTAAFHVMF